MLAKTYSAAVLGVDAYTVEIEINATSRGEESYVSIVGLPDAAVRESKERVWSAMHSSGYFFPQGSTLINLAPADIKKEGASFDLPIALGMLAVRGDIDRGQLSRIMAVGELALDGSVRPVKGVLPVALHAASQNHLDAIMVPAANAPEAAAVSQKVPVFPVETLIDATGFFGSQRAIPFQLGLEEYFSSFPPRQVPDFADVKGQAAAKRALEIAATGGHNVMMIGPPGTGKSMLAKRVPGILPPMTLDEALETSKIHSILGKLTREEPLLRERPFRSPHHTISDAGLLGGGQNPTPGEVSLSHNGVLFLDEMPEFKRNVLEVLRQPLENGTITVSRAAGSFTFPARFILIAAMNPCPCGHYGGTQRVCRCNPNQIQRYRGKISGPLLDRIDIHVEVAALSEDELINAPSGESSKSIRERVVTARKLQGDRFDGSGIYCNAQMEPKQLQKFCKLDKESETHLRHAIRELQLSARAYDRILRVARTIADLENSPAIGVEHIYEAVNYRSLDRRLW